MIFAPLASISLYVAKFSIIISLVTLLTLLLYEQQSNLDRLLEISLPKCFEREHQSLAAVFVYFWLNDADSYISLFEKGQNLRWKPEHDCVDIILSMAGMSSSTSPERPELAFHVS